jgi:frataxin-like iron-binding protein CyaY
MDARDFTITVVETFDAIDRRLNELAVNGVETLAENGSMSLRFSDDSEIRLAADEDAQQLLATADTEALLFRFHEVEEQWLDEHGNTELFEWLSVKVTLLCGEAVSLNED